MLLRAVLLVGCAVAISSCSGSGVQTATGLVTESVEPDVVRVVNDGVRDLSWHADRPGVYHGGALNANIAAAAAGGVWLFRPDGFFELGEARAFGWDGQLPALMLDDFEIVPDGTIWRVIYQSGGPGEFQLRSFDGSGWSERMDRPSDLGWVQSVEIASDGTVWAAWTRPIPSCDRSDDVACEEHTVSRLDADGWSDRPFTAQSVLHRPGMLAVSPGGTVWHAAASPDGRTDVLARLDGAVWEQLEPIPGASGGFPLLDIGADGTLWARLGACCQASLARLDETGWSIFTAADEVPASGYHYGGFEGFLVAGPDGSVWLNPNGDAGSTGTECDGLARFDGTGWDHYLRDTCIYALDVAADGSAWVQAGTWELETGRRGPVDVYRIVAGPGQG